jgi:hypothetical protein
VLRFEVHVHPGAKQPRVGGTYAGALIVKVRERAVDGAATEAVRDAVAAAFDVPASYVTCLRGHRARRKFFAVEGDDAQLAARHLELLSA